MKNWLSGKRLRHALLALLLCAAATAVRAGTVSGVVHNGTNSNKPAAGRRCAPDPAPGRHADRGEHEDRRRRTLSLRQSCDRRRADVDSRGLSRQCFFTSRSPRERRTVDVTVYEPTTNPAALQVPLRLLVFQPNGDKLMVGEEFSILNNSNPPAGLFQAGRQFRVHDSGRRGARPGFHLWPLGHAREAGHDRQGEGPLRDRVRVSTRPERRAHFLHPSLYRRSCVAARDLHVRRAARFAGDSADHAGFQRRIRSCGHRAGI